MLVLTRKVNESIMIGDEIEITVLGIKDDQVRIGIKAPRIVRVHRQEVFAAIAAENRKAAEAAGSPAAVALLDGLLAAANKKNDENGRKTEE